VADIIINPGTSVQATINGAFPGDRILLNPGLFNSDNVVTVNKQLTLMANVPGTLPNVSLNGPQFGNVFSIAASDVTVDGLDIDNLRGGGAGFGYYSITVPASNVMIKNARLHHFRRAAIGVYGALDGFALLDSWVYRMGDTPFTFMNVKNMLVRGNWVFDQFYVGGEAAFDFFVPDDVGTSEISYNYVEGIKFGIGLKPWTAAAAAAGTITVAHNTIDMRMLPLKPVNTDAPFCMRRGTSFYSGTGAFRLNGAAVDWRDNLTTRTLAYPIYLSDAPCLYAPMTIRNCLFWDGYWKDWPTVGRQEFEWYGEDHERLATLVPSRKHQVLSDHRAQPCQEHAPPLAGWGSAADRAMFKHEGCLQADPGYALVGADPTTFYALRPGSPARGAATDRTNIGAWQ